MAWFTKQEAASICGIKTNELAVYVERKKIIVETDNEGKEWIDANNPLNSFFMTKKLEKRGIINKTPLDWHFENKYNTEQTNNLF